MILRFATPALPLHDKEFSPVWSVIEATQKQDPRACRYLITQPAHAALSGEIAGSLKPGFFGELDAEIIRAISLHDSGWSNSDARQIAEVRGLSGSKGAKGMTPVSFLSIPVKEAVAAWTASIEMAEKLSHLSGYLVSAHFWRLASDSKQAEHRKFAIAEKTRQEMLAPKISKSHAELARLVDALQFSDVLSLYFCCGATENVRFPQNGGIELERTEEGCRLRPAVFSGPRQFCFSALHFSHGGRGPGGEIMTVTVA